MVRKRDGKGKIMTNPDDGHELQKFWWVPIPAAFGFALILPPSLSIGTALGCVIAAIWRKFSHGHGSAYAHFAPALGAGLIAGEAIVGGILLPVIGVLIELFVKPLL